MPGQNHTAPCAWVKTLLAVAGICVTIALFGATGLKGSVKDVQVETRDAVHTLDADVSKLEADTRARAISVSRIEERLAAIQQSLTRIERELERMKNPAPRGALERRTSCPIADSPS